METRLVSCILVLVLVFSNEADCLPPEFVTPSGGHWPHSTVYVKRRVEQPCQAVGDPSSSYKWIMNGTDIVKQSSVSFMEDTGLLFSDDFRSQDNGLYQCVAYNSDGAVMTSHLTLISAYLEPFSGVSEAKAQTVTATQYLSIPCFNIPASQPPVIFGWQNGEVQGSQLENANDVSDSERTVVDPEGTLHFLWLTHADNFRGFGCFGYNEVMLTKIFSRNITLLILQEEKISSDRGPTLVYNKDVVAMEGDTATLTCIFTYYSFKGERLVIDWFKDSTGNSLGQGRTYTIRSVHPEREGDYTCQAKLGSKVVIGIVNLRVVGPPKFLPDQQPVSKTMEIGSNVTLLCGTTSSHFYSKPPVWLNNLQPIIGCPPGMFECGQDQDGSVSRCLSAAARCDGNRDCPGGEDENYCPDTCPEQKEGQKCADCPYPLFRCFDNSNCIGRDNLCDGSSDCTDKSDEIACPKSLPKKIGKFHFNPERTEMTIVDVSPSDAMCVHCMVTNLYGTTIGTACLTDVTPATEEPPFTTHETPVTEEPPYTTHDYFYNDVTSSLPTYKTSTSIVADRTTKRKKLGSSEDGKGGGGTIVVVIVVLIAVIVIAVAIVGVVLLHRKKKICANKCGNQQEYESRFTDATICEMFSHSMDTLAGIRQSQLQPSQGQTMELMTQVADDSQREDLFP